MGRETPAYWVTIPRGWRPSEDCSLRISVALVLLTARNRGGVPTENVMYPDVMFRNPAAALAGKVLAAQLLIARGREGKEGVPTESVMHPDAMFRSVATRSASPRRAETRVTVIHRGGANAIQSEQCAEPVIPSMRLLGRIDMRFPHSPAAQSSSLGNIGWA